MSSPATADDPALFLAIEDLGLAAQGIVEGALHGLHRSPFRGFSVEFESHREYRQGDDLRYVNWSLSARHRRLFVKEFRADTNLNLYLLVDASASMRIAHGPASKFAYAARAAAALAYLAHRTHDACGLYLLRKSLEDALPPRTGRVHFETLTATLAATHPEGPGNLGAALGDALEACRRKGIVVLFSDLFDADEAEVLHGLRVLREAGQEVVLFQILDPWETQLPEDGDFEFVDPESGQRLEASTPIIAESVRSRVREWREMLRHECEASGIDWVSCTTADPLAGVVVEYLSQRAKLA